MKKSIPTYFLIVVLFLATGLFSLSSIVVKNKNNQIATLKMELLNYEGIISHQMKNDSIQILYSGLRLDSSILLTDESGFQVPLYEVGDRKMLFFKYTEFSCDPCIEQELELLESIIDNNIDYKVIVISSYKDIGYLYRFKRINNLQHLPFYNIHNQSIIDELDKINIPYYFTINESLSIRSLYIPSKTLEQPNERYINSALSICVAQ